jgi:hypothetical protein
MDTSMDTANRPLQGPIRPSEESSTEKYATIADLVPAPMFVSVLKSLPTPAEPPGPPAPPPVVAQPVSAADVEMASKRYVASLTSYEKAQARVLAARKELDAALAEETTAAKHRDALQQELLRYLTK